MDLLTDEPTSAEHGAPWPGARVEFVETADAVSLRVARIGQGEPLLLINGLGANLEMWQPLVRELAGAREVIAFDLPGTGRSARPRRPLRMPQLAQLVGDLLDGLGHRRLDVLGYSLGGIVAQELAYRAPARVSRLVLCATTPGLPSVPPDPVVTALMLTPARPRPARASDGGEPRRSRRSAPRGRRRTAATAGPPHRSRGGATRSGHPGRRASGRPTP
jgi:pimeloyl-ACP methyl ester carboxylesterase